MGMEIKYSGDHYNPLESYLYTTDKWYCYGSLLHSLEETKYTLFFWISKIQQNQMKMKKKVLVKETVIIFTVYVAYLYLRGWHTAHKHIIITIWPNKLQ